MILLERLGKYKSENVYLRESEVGKICLHALITLSVAA